MAQEEEVEVEQKLISIKACAKTCVLFSIVWAYLGAIYGTSLALNKNKTKLETIGRVFLYFLVGGGVGGAMGLVAPVVVPVLGLYYVAKNEIIKF